MNAGDGQPEPSRFRGLLQFSLRALLVLVAVCSVCLGIAFHRAREQARAVSLIESLGGTVTYDYQWTQSGEWNGLIWKVRWSRMRESTSCASDYPKSWCITER
jgi:hypothetical protein